MAHIPAAVDADAPRLCPPRRRGAPHSPPSRDPPGSCHKRGLENPAWTDYPPAHCRRDVRSGAWTRPMRGPRTAGDAARARLGGSRRSPSCASCPRRDRSREAWAGYRAPPCRVEQSCDTPRVGETPPTLILVLGVIGLMSCLAERVAIPAPVLLAVAGMVWSLSPLPSLEIEPRLILSVF